MTYKLSKTDKKIIVQFELFIKRESIQEEIKKIRKILKIPKNGLNFNKNTQIKMPENNENHYISSDFRWIHKNTYKKETKGLIEKFPIMDFYYELVVRNYIYYNKLLFKEILEICHPNVGACKILNTNDIVEMFTIPDKYEETAITEESWNNKIYQYIDKFPVFIAIHKGSSKTSVIEHIKNNWKEIEEDLSEGIGKVDFSFKNSKTRLNKNTTQIRDFIYKNYKLGKKTREISSLLTKNFKTGVGHLTEGHINKIISEEKKKREK